MRPPASEVVATKPLSFSVLTVNGARTTVSSRSGLAAETDWACREQTPTVSKPAAVSSPSRWWSDGDGDEGWCMVVGETGRQLAQRGRARPETGRGEMGFENHPIIPLSRFPAITRSGSPAARFHPCSRRAIVMRRSRSPSRSRRASRRRHDSAEADRDRYRQALSRPRSNPRATASARSAACSLERRAFTWALAVFSDTPSNRPISALVKPCRTRLRVSNSRREM